MLFNVPRFPHKYCINANVAVPSGSMLVPTVSTIHVEVFRKQSTEQQADGTKRNGTYFTHTGVRNIWQKRKPSFQFTWSARVFFLLLNFFLLRYIRLHLLPEFFYGKMRRVDRSLSPLFRLPLAIFKCWQKLSLPPLYSFSTINSFTAVSWFSVFFSEARAKIASLLCCVMVARGGEAVFCC